MLRILWNIKGNAGEWLLLGSRMLLFPYQMPPEPASGVGEVLSKEKPQALWERADRFSKRNNQACRFSFFTLVNLGGGGCESINCSPVATKFEFVKRTKRTNTAHFVRILNVL